MSLHNEVRLIGYCAAKPKLFKSKRDVSVARVSVYTPLPGATWYEKASERHTCVFLGKKADVANQLIEKGTHIHLSGILQYKDYEYLEKTFRQAQIMVESFFLSPKEKASLTLKRTLKEILDENGLERAEDIGILNEN